MNKSMVALLAFMVIIPSICFGKGHGGGSRSHSSGSRSNVSVRSYNKRSGTHVNAHKRTPGDNTKTNNWSIKGNVNPYTGQPGTKSPK